MMYEYLDDNVSFRSAKALDYRTIYAPLCGIDATGLKSSITPRLSGDIKIDKMRYLTKPCSTEDLRQVVRNFFVVTEQGDVCSLASSDESTGHVEVGQLWHRLVRPFDQTGIEMTALNFVPVSGEDVEIMQVTIKNTGEDNCSFTSTAAIPLFARALANKHDHEHVTSLLHRIYQKDQGVIVEPCMLFDEEGHRNTDQAYFVLGVDEDGQHPSGSFPTQQSFYGDSGDAMMPDAIRRKHAPTQLDEVDRYGQEAMGALQFAPVTLAPGASKTYIIVIGTAEKAGDIDQMVSPFQTTDAVEKALSACRAFWAGKSSSLTFQSGDSAFNAWMRWVTLQPVLRRIYGCSFMPDHDYGKGGKGWRDIWQDLLSLILIEPDEVRQTLIDNCGGVRIDGSNATIIGAKPGEFIADRNAITRVWMDHGVWPLKTILLYVHQTGDFDILTEQGPYFRDPQQSRIMARDEKWTPADGNVLKTTDGNVYQGSVLEHLLVQNLVQFFNVGEHNNIRLESADWNDGLDMAFDRGESVAFTAAYAGNLKELADLLDTFSEVKQEDMIVVARELVLLLDTLSETSVNYDSVDDKKRRLFDTYFGSVQPAVSGKTASLLIKDVAADLRAKAVWMTDHMRTQEKINVDGKTWFNGYYDNQAQRVEGKKDDSVWMTLTGQVFPVMSGVATREDTMQVIEAADAYLRDPELGGYRLNTNFGLKNYLDLGRAFGFAFGTKENGAFFSHMIVMYAYALYHQGFARAGHRVLQSIYDMSVDTERSKIYPGVPEYIDNTGRGMYHYLTGSASWFVLTELTQVFGVRGDWGNLVLAPQLVKEQFDADGKAGVSCYFAGKRLTINYQNGDKKEAGDYCVQAVSALGNPLAVTVDEKGAAHIARSIIADLPESVALDVQLG